MDLKINKRWQNACGLTKNEEKGFMMVQMSGNDRIWNNKMQINQTTTLQF